MELQFTISYLNLLHHAIKAFGHGAQFIVLINGSPQGIIPVLGNGTSRWTRLLIGVVMMCCNFDKRKKATKIDMAKTNAFPLSHSVEEGNKTCSSPTENGVCRSFYD